MYKVFAVYEVFVKANSEARATMYRLDPCHVLNPESRVMSLEFWLLISRFPEELYS